MARAALCEPPCADFVAGTALCEPPCVDFVAGTALCDSPCADFVAGTALCDPPCADFVAGTALCDPPCADFVAGAALCEAPCADFVAVAALCEHRFQGANDVLTVTNKIFGLHFYRRLRRLLHVILMTTPRFTHMTCFRLRDEKELGYRVSRRQRDVVLLRLVVAVHTCLRNTSYIRRAHYSPIPLLCNSDIIPDKTIL